MTKDTMIVTDYKRRKRDEFLFGRALDNAARLIAASVADSKDTFIFSDRYKEYVRYLFTLSKELHIELLPLRGKKK